MNNEKNDAYFVQKIRKDLEFISVHMRSVEIEELNEDEVLLDSMMFRMILFIIRLRADAKEPQGIRILLLCGLIKPLHRCFPILSHTVTAAIQTG